MQIEVSDESLTWLAKNCQRPLRDTLAHVLRAMRKHSKFLEWKAWGGAPTSLGLLICSDAEIRAYNRDYRKMDKATDVLSFPTIEASAEPMAGSEGYLGDMIISFETVERAAKRVRRTTQNELVEVFVHGILHLLGFDHLIGKGVTKKDAAEMKTLQRELFAELRPLITKRYGSFVKKRQRHQRIS